MKFMGAGIHRPDEEMSPRERDAESNGTKHAEDEKNERIIHGDQAAGEPDESPAAAQRATGRGEA